MAVILFRLNGVPEDEAREVRALLEGHEIDFYETSAGNWGVSFAALWLKDESRFAEARRLIDAHQQERRERVRREYRRRVERGGPGVLFDALRENPLRALLYLAAVVVVLYLSTVPFFNFTEWL